MEKIVLLALSVSLMLVAGCSTIPVTQSSSSDGLKMNEIAQIKNGDYVLNASINSIAVDNQGTDNRLIDIYIKVKNTGTKTANLIWFSKITDRTGKSYGGIGISHGGSGAVSGQVDPGDTSIARDYIRINSDRDYAELAKGATLDVFFVEQDTASGQKTTYQRSWTIEPGYFK
jgi:hypothetical protein